MEADDHRQYNCICLIYNRGSLEFYSGNNVLFNSLKDEIMSVINNNLVMLNELFVIKYTNSNLSKSDSFN